MEIKRIVHGDINAYFKVLEASLLSDYNTAVQEEHSSDVLKSGLTYQKTLRNRFGNEGKVTVLIDRFEPNHYSASFRSAQGINQLSYDLEPIDDNQFEVTYKEDFISESKSKNLNYSLMSKLYNRSSKKKMNLMLDAIERMIHE